MKRIVILEGTGSLH